MGCGSDGRKEPRWCLISGVNPLWTVVESLSHVQLFATPGTIARQAPLSMGFSIQEYWSGFPLPSPGDLPDPGMEPNSPALAGRFFTTMSPGKSLG